MALSAPILELAGFPVYEPMVNVPPKESNNEIIEWVMKASRHDNGGIAGIGVYMPMLSPAVVII